MAWTTLFTETWSTTCAEGNYLSTYPNWLAYSAGTDGTQGQWVHGSNISVLTPGILRMRCYVDSSGVGYSSVLMRHFDDQPANSFSSSLTSFRWQYDMRCISPIRGFHYSGLVWPSDNVWDAEEDFPELDLMKSDGTLGVVQGFHHWYTPPSGPPSGQDSYTSTVVLADGNWHTYAWEWDSTSVRLYIDDMSTPKKTFTGHLPSEAMRGPMLQMQTSPNTGNPPIAGQSMVVEYQNFTVSVPSTGVQAQLTRAQIIAGTAARLTRAAILSGASAQVTRASIFSVTQSTLTTGDTSTLGEVSNLSQAALTVTSGDSFALAEIFTDTITGDGTDDSATTEVSALATLVTTGDPSTGGDDLTASIPTGGGVTSVGGGVNSSYVIAVAADAADVNVGDQGLIYNASGALTERTLFTVYYVSDVFAGYVNVFYTPPAQDAPDAGDQFVVVAPGGSQLATGIATGDGGTLTDVSQVTVAITSTDTGALSDTSGLSTTLARADVGALADTSGLTPLLATGDGVTLTDSSLLNSGGAFGSGDVSALADASTLAVLIASTDSGGLSETSNPGQSITSGDVAGLSETSLIGPLSADAGMLGESSLLGTGGTFGSTDTSAATDISTLSVVIVSSDSSASLDASTPVGALLATTDASGAADQSLLDQGTGYFASGDTATLSEASAVAAVLTGVDQLAVAELSVIVAALSGGDTWIGDGEGFAGGATTLAATDTAALSEVSAVLASLGDDDGGQLVDRIAALTRTQVQASRAWTENWT